jgi:hypothetical protein
MSTDADKYWESFAKKLQKYKGLRPLTPREADEALRQFSKRPVDCEEIERFVDAAFNGEIIEAEPAPATNLPLTFDLGSMNAESLAMFRNQGDDSDAADVEEELRQELMNDDEPEEDSDGVGG